MKNFIRPYPLFSLGGLNCGLCSLRQIMARCATESTPEIIKSSEPFQTVEACLSLEGTRETKRYKSIKVQYQNTNLPIL